MKPRDRLRIAVQKSGRLAEASQALLAGCGLRFRQSRDKLFCFGETLPVDLLLVRDDDIPGLIAEGVCDIGVVGRNILEEQRRASQAAGAEPAFRELRALGFGQCRLALAIPQDMAWQGPAQLQGLRIATTYPALLSAWLAEQGVDARVVTLSGSVEIAPRLGSADLICDLVSSGATLAANQLREAAVLLQSEAVLAAPSELPADERGELVELLLRRIDGVIQVRDTKLLMLQAPRSAMERIGRVLPDGSTPVLTPVEGQADQVAMQALCRGAITWQHLEAIKGAGASHIFVLPVEQVLH